MIEFAAETHTGNRYQHNEDSMGWREREGLWLVADGMGGHARGEVASGVVKRSILSAASEPGRSLTSMIMIAHEAIVLEAIERSLHNMGSTVVLVKINEGLAEIAWCGDSRVYLWRQGELIRVTRDHSLLEQLLESGVVAPEQAFGHPQKHVLVQALGIENPRPEPSQITLELANDDLLLLCSDGLHDEVRDEGIAEILRASSSPNEIVSRLTQQVLAGEARDNISIICLRLSELADNPDIISTEVLRAKLMPEVRRQKDNPAARHGPVAVGAHKDTQASAAPGPEVEVEQSTRFAWLRNPDNWSLLAALVGVAGLIVLISVFG